MKLEDYTVTSDKLLALANEIEAAKRPAYTGDNTDVLHNFKEVAVRLGLKPIEVWGVYFLKHIDAITSYVKDQEIPQAEPIETRFADALNYLKLGLAIIYEPPPK